MELSRRKVLGTAGAALVANFFGVSASKVLADAAQAQESIETFTGDAEATTGGLTLTAPEIAENGNTVPISIAVDSPMTEESYVDSVIIIAEGNPSPDVATFNFSPASGIAKATTRMRLAKTQNVIAVAKLSDGTFLSDTRTIKVTIGGCGG